MKDHYCFFPPKRVIKVSLTSERNTIITLHSSVILFYFIQSHLKFVFLKEKERVSLKGQGWRGPGDLCTVLGFKRDCGAGGRGELAVVGRMDAGMGLGQLTLTSTSGASGTAHLQRQLWRGLCGSPVCWWPSLPEPGLQGWGAGQEQAMVPGRARSCPHFAVLRLAGRGAQGSGGMRGHGPR